MTCIRTTRQLERVWQSRPYLQHPGRRESIHGRVVGLPNIRRPKVVTKFVKFLRGAAV